MNPNHIIEHLIEDHLIKNYTVQHIIGPETYFYKLTPLDKTNYTIEIMFEEGIKVIYQQPTFQVPQWAKRKDSKIYLKKMVNPSNEIAYEHHTYDIHNPNYEQQILQFIKECHTRHQNLMPQKYPPQNQTPQTDPATPPTT
jgi:hypothetical protein